MSYLEDRDLRDKLRGKGFKDPGVNAEDTPICAMMLGPLRVDFMPADDKVLGFASRWYKDAMRTANGYQLQPDLQIQLVSPVYFVAIKLEAYKGRGKGYVLESRDIEDLLILIDGREELALEVRQAEAGVQEYIAEEIANLLGDSHFEYAVQSQARSSGGEREDVIFERLEQLLIVRDE